jgi:hypothetical protein
MHKVVAISSDANWSRRTPDRGLGWLSMEWQEVIRTAPRRPSMTSANGENIAPPPT